MVYVPASEASDNVDRVIYQAKDGSSSKTFLALDWLAHLVSHIPGKGEQMVRGYDYSNRYEDDYSQLPAEELCLKHTSSR